MGNIRVFRNLRGIDSFTRTSIESLLSQCEIADSSDIRDYIDVVDQKYLICAFDENNEACGFAEIESEDNDINLQRLYVHYHDRNKGYATELLKAVKKVAKEEKKDFIELVVKFDNINARSLYKKYRYLNTHIISGKVVGMTKFTNNNNYVMGGILYEVLKSKQEMSILDIKNSDNKEFEKYVKSKDKKTVVDKIIDSSTFIIACDLLKLYKENKYKKEDFDKIYNIIKYDRDLSVYPQMMTYDKNELKTAVLSIKAMLMIDKEKEVDKEIEQLFDSEKE